MPARRLPNPFTPAELSALQGAADAKCWAAITFLVETGLRSAEAMSITSQEARGWRRPPWWCRRRRCKAHTVALRIVGKGDKERVVPLSTTALRAATVLLAASSNGHMMPWSDRGLRWAFADAGKRCGVHCHAHRCRHTFASSLIEAGAPVEVVADMLGHSSINTTRIYWTASLSSKRRALALRPRRSHF